MLVHRHISVAKSSSWLCANDTRSAGTMHSTFFQEGRRCGSLKRETGSVAEGGSQGTLVSGVAQRYATALFELAEENGAVDTVAAALDSFNGLLAVSLAGRAAEEELLGCVSAGAGGSPDSDMGKATTLALAMETELGFGETWPLLYRQADNQTTLLAYNPLLAEEVNARLEAAYARARELIRRNEDAIRFLADALMRHDTLEGPALVIVLKEVGKRVASAESDQ